MILIALVLVQTHSIWNYNGDLVDESEIVHYAIGFFGGDYDPHWDGYGALNMYVLHVAYRLLFVVQYITGGPSDAVEFAAQTFDNGRLIFGLGRAMYAAIGVAALYVLARAARRLGIPTFVAAAWLALVAMTAANIHFANYIRADQLVAFGLVLVVVAPTMSSPRRQLLLAVVGSAVAAAAKISALPLLALPVALWWWRFRHRPDRWRVLGMAAMGMFVLLWALQPFLNPIELAHGLLGRRVGDAPFRWGADASDQIVNRIAGTATSIVEWTGPATVVGLAGLVLARGRIARHALWALAATAATIAPYLITTEVRYYWYRPAHFVLWYLALLGGWVAVRRVADEPRATRLASIGLAVGALFVVFSNTPRLWDLPDRNFEEAMEWLEQKRAGGEQIVLDAPYLQHLPKIYDPTMPTQAKEISRAFIFNRWDHEFLNYAFLTWLVTDYGRDMTSSPKSLDAIRVDLDLPVGARVPLPVLRLCDPQGSCSVKPPTRTEDLVIEPGIPGATSQGPSPRVMYEDLGVVGDGTTTVVIDIAHSGGTEESLPVYFDTGGGYSEDEKVRVRPGRNRLLAWHPYPQRRVLALEPLPMDDPATTGLLAELDGSLLVTSPSIYQRFYGADVTSLPADRQETLEMTLEWYDYMRSGDLVRRFDTDSGPVIEVHRIPGVAAR